MINQSFCQLIKQQTFPSVQLFRRGMPVPTSTNQQAAWCVRPVGLSEHPSAGETGGRKAAPVLIQSEVECINGSVRLRKEVLKIMTLLNVRALCFVLSHLLTSGKQII